MAAGETRIKIREVILVEGKYDKNTLSQVADATILTTRGFALFRDKKLRSLLIRMANERGIIVLTDSDGAGLLIRGHLRGILPPHTVKHAYIPQIPGKEKRKSQAGASGLLGVEGMTPEILTDTLIRAGATCGENPGSPVTKQDLYVWGLSGGVNSAILRRNLQKKLDLPQNLSAKALCEILTVLGLRDKIPTLLEDDEKR